MLRVARALTHTARVRYLQGTAEALPLPDDAATLVWSIATVHHWRDVDAALREVRRILRPSGRFVAIERATTPDATGLASHGWTEEQAAAFAQQCRDHGFTVVQVEASQPSRRRSVVSVTGTAKGP
jgi:ubiquinone/menaquinone biosynthesis C-methylase UbiE